MEAEKAKKIVKAKLYNLKSVIDGMITMMDVGTISPGGAIDSMCSVVAKATDEFNEAMKIDPD